ncbi:MAG: hypothetical protein COT14_00785 [Candidatus Diapherotrites archaeon CG08_land_8_20_14_0_20_30_16]|nr:MAG: hypothetical protein COT14_00785 [Candidatus Diapherotrites archaeon CG08_land_8_20_14_0_20_30_16]
MFLPSEKIKEDKQKKADENKVSEDINKESIEEKTEPSLICKDSCPLDGKCYPFGYRKQGKFCFDDGTFKQQLTGDTACENNFECTSNICINNQCVAQSFIQKIIDWLKKFFGMV